MSFVLNKLSTKKEVDNAIKTCEDKVLVLRFGRETDTVCQQLDDILDIVVDGINANPSSQDVFSFIMIREMLALPMNFFFWKVFAQDFSVSSLAKTSHDVSRMADIYIVDVDTMPVYTRYFDISLIPATVFFFNGQHMKVDYGTPDHTKFIGSFKTKQDFIDLVEVILRGALRGKLIVTSPIDPQNVPKYNLLYKDI